MIDCTEDSFSRKYRGKAITQYGDSKVLDIEAALLSNHSTAVNNYREEKSIARKEKKLYPDGQPPPPDMPYDRKKSYGQGSH